MGTGSESGAGSTEASGTGAASSGDGSPSSSMPSNPPTPEATVSPAQERWAAMSLEQQVASVLMLHYPGTDAAGIAAFVQEIQPAGLILMGDNVPADETELAASIAGWNAVASAPLLVGIDEEGGTVRRLALDVFPAAPELRDGDPAATEAAFRERGQLLENLGITTNFGVVADVTADTSSFIWPRVLGSTPDAAASQVAAAVRGEQGLVHTTLKHFPGHGLSAGDSHISIPTSEVTYDEWLEAAAPPFESGIGAGAEMVMVGHLLFPQIAPEPASLSPRWHEILREDLGFDGIIVTDAMEMLQGSGLPEYADPVANAVLTLQAGSDLVLIASGGADEARLLVAGIAEAVRSGALDSAVLEAAGVRVMEARLGL
ncbi:MAG: glycoside hydrolase family 3 N-terminal domain-containing protein [Ancrocorticia sp.]